MLMQTNVFSQKLVKDINTTPNGSDVRNFVQLNDITLFYADDLIHGRSVWKTDGTIDGTAFVNNAGTTGFSNYLCSFTTLLKLHKYIFMLI